MMLKPYYPYNIKEAINQNIYYPHSQAAYNDLDFAYFLASFSE